MKTCVIFNPTARGDKAKAFRARLASLAGAAVLKPTHAAGAGRLLAAEAVREGFEVIVAAGGDGTVNEVLNGMADEPHGLEQARLGVLPLGTINVFARELGLPRGFDAAWRVITAGREASVDLPEAEFAGAGRRERRCFAQLAGAGLDSRAIELVDWERKKAFGPLAYVFAGLEAAMERQPRIIVESDAVCCEGELVLIGNGRRYGGDFDLFPAAALCDGRLSVAVFPRVNVPVLVRFGWGWLTDRLHAATDCRTFQAESLTLSTEHGIAVELDGDNVGRLPARFSIRPGALRVLVP